MWTPRQVRAIYRDSQRPRRKLTDTNRGHSGWAAFLSLKLHEIVISVLFFFRAPGFPSFLEGNRGKNCPSYMLAKLFCTLFFQNISSNTTNCVFVSVWMWDMETLLQSFLYFIVNKSLSITCTVTMALCFVDACFL